MLVEGGVSRAKFQRQVDMLEAQRALLSSQGCFVLRTQFPHIDVLIISTLPACVNVPRKRRGRLVLAGPEAVERHLVEVPHAVGRPVAVRLSLDDYDLLPPSISFRDPLDWSVPLPLERAPTCMNFVKGQHVRVIPGNHPRTGLPFFCMPGSREYHEHPQHDGDDWFLYRSQMSVVDIISTLWRCCVVNVRPVMTLQDNGQTLQFDHARMS